MELGCEHYKAGAKIVTPCCNKIFRCRRCHNDDNDHAVDLAEIQQIVCFRCNTRQVPSNKCVYCDLIFGEYACLKCKLFDVDKRQYHCTECGICRIGPEDRYFHCRTCNQCLNIILRNNHQCVKYKKEDAKVTESSALRHKVLITDR